MDDWQVGEVVFAHAPPLWDGRGVRFKRQGPPLLDGRGVTFDYLKASRFDDTATTVNTAEAATDDDGWSIVSLYYGGDAVQTNSKKPLILTERASEARGAYIYEVKFQPGYTVNVDALRSDGGIDYHGRARYLVFLDKIVAVHPDEDLKLVGRRKLKVLKYNPFHDELGRFATGDSGGNTIEADIAEATGGGMALDPTAEGYAVVTGHPYTGEYQVIYNGTLVAGGFKDKAGAMDFATSVAGKPVTDATVPPGYMVIPNVDEDGDHGGYNVYHNNKLITNVESETVAHAFIAQDAKVKTGPDESGGKLPGGVLVGTPDGLPSGYSVVPNHDTQDFTVLHNGQQVGQFDQKISAVEFANEHVVTSTMAQNQLSTAAQTLGGFHLSSYSLPAGWTVQPTSDTNATASAGFKVVGPDGLVHTFGSSEKEAVDHYFDSHPQDAMPEGHTWVSGNILDDKGNVVYSQIDPNQPHSQAIEEFLNGPKAPDQFHIGAGTHVQSGFMVDKPGSTEPKTFVPGVEHLPKGYAVVPGTTPGGYSWKVVNESGGIAGGGFSQAEALHDYFEYQPQQILPDGQYLNNATGGGYTVTDANGNRLYESKGAESGLEAVVNYMNQSAGITTPVAAVAEAGTGTGPAVHPGINNLPHGYELQESGSGTFHVVHPDGYWVGTGKTQEEALSTFFDQHPKLALPEGFSIHHNYDTQGSDIKDASGNTVFTSPQFVHGYDAVVAYMTHEANKEQEVTSTLGTLPETRFGTGAGGGYEPLSEAGLPPGFNVTHDDTSHFEGTGEVRPPSVHQFTTSEKDTVHSYTGSGNSDLNHYLREGNTPDNPGTTSRLLRDLDAVFADTSTASTMTLYRGISANAVRKLDEAIKNTDGHFVDKGFASTSSDEGTARSWKSGDYVTIEVPAGSKAFDTEHPKRLTSHPGESEWIIDRNSHYVITKREKSSVSYSSHDHWHYFAKLVNFVQEKDTRQLDLPFVDVGPVNKQRPDEDHVDKFIWDESGIVPDYTYQKYNPFHDDAGRFSSGDGGGTTIEADIAEATGGGTLPEMSPDGPIVYHGTSTAMLDSILKDGLVAEKGKGADEFLIQNLDPHYKEDRAPSVYFAGSPINAEMYAHYAAKATGSTAVVIPIRLTEAQAKQLVWDEHGGGAGEMRLPTGFTIPPSQIGTPRIGRPAIDVLTSTVMGYRGVKNKRWFDFHPIDPKQKTQPVKLLGKPTPTGVRAVMGKAEAADTMIFAVILIKPVKPKGQGFLDKGQGFLDAEQTYAEVDKYNMWHDLKGLFSSGPGGGGGDEHGSTGSAAASDTTIGELISPHGTEAQREAVSDYTDEGYLDVNNFLRHDEEPRFPTSTQSVIKHLDTILEHSTLPKETTVYRGLSRSATERLQKALDTGNTSFYDKGFISTTASEHYAGVFASSMLHNHAIAEIVLPKGTHARDIKDWSSSPDEQEILVARDSAFKVVRHEIDDDTGLSVYHLRLLPDYDPNQLDLPLGKAKGATDKYIWSGEEMIFLVEKYNEAHDERGRFASGDGSGGGGGDHINQVGGAPLESWTDHPTDIAGWAKVEGQMPDLEEPPFHTDHGERTASGVVIQEPDGRVWLVHPTNQFGGYNATFPKGGVEPGLSMQANAIKEAYEETGLKVRITGYARDVERTTSKTRYYFAERVGGNPRDHEQHTDHLSLVPPDKLHSVADHPIDAPLIDQIRSTKKYNPNHDEAGRFAEGSSDGGNGGTSQTQGDRRFSASRELTKEEKLGVGMYTATTAYREINEAYRKGFSLKNTPKMQAHADNLAKAIASRTVAEPITVYRGIRNEKLINQLDAAVATGNNEFTDRGFASTSFSQHAALEFTAWHQDSTKYMMRINIPKGAHALAASAEGLGARDEEEVVLQHGSRFRVTARHDEGNQVVYDADMLIDE